MKILLLEDELMLQSAINEYLETLGHNVDSFSDGQRALQAIKSRAYDLLILDINVPTIDGFELLQKLHEEKIYTPTIFTSALIGIEDITKGFELGASDYLKKPFHLKELELRIERVKELLDAPTEHIVLTKHYHYDSSIMQLYFDKEPQRLSKRQLQIVDLLAKNRDMVVNFDHFREYVWEHEPIDNPTIRTEINRLKRALKEDFIQNIRGLGYTISRPKA